MLPPGVLDLIVTNAVQALHEHHHRRHAHPGHLGRVVERPGGESVRGATGLANRRVTEVDELRMERLRGDPPEPLPRDLHAGLRGKSSRGPLRRREHRRERFGLEMPLVERERAVLDHARDDARLRRAGADRAHAVATRRGDPVDFGSQP